MPANIKKVALQKKIESTLYTILPKTEATIVEYTRGSGQDAVVTTVAAELARIAGVADSKLTESQVNTIVENAITTLIGDDQSALDQYFDTIKEISEYIVNNQDAIGIITDLSTDLGKASNGSTAATGLHADVEQLQEDVEALQEANGTNVSKTKSGSANADNGELYLDGVLTTIYDDDDLWASVGASTDTAAAAGTTAWSRIKNAENDIDALESGLGVASANADSAGTTAWSRIKNAESDIDTLQAAVGASTDTASSTGTTAWSRIKALEAVEATKVEDGTTNGYIKVNGTDDAIQVYDDTAIKNALGTSGDAAAAAGTTAWSRIKNAESDIDTLQAAVGASTDTANASGTTAWSRIKNAETDIDALESGLGASTDTASASGTTAWSRIKAIEAWEDQIQYVTSAPASPSSNVLYLVEIA